MSAKFIKPTVGRMVHFFKYVEGQGHKGPLAAVVAKVWSDRCVNLTVHMEGGETQPTTSVPLIQADEECPQSDYCTWMPYQVGQAEKTAELQRVYDAALAGAGAAGS